MALKTIENRLDSAIRIFFYFMIFWLPYSKAMIEITVIATSVLWMTKRSLRFWENKKKGRHKMLGQSFREAFSISESPANMPIFVFCVLCLFSVIGSSMQSQSLVGFINKTLEWFAIYFLALEVFVKEKHFQRASNIFVVTTFVTALDALLQFYFFKKDLFFKNLLVDQCRVTAAFGHPNLLGGYFSFAVPFLFAQLFAPARKYFPKPVLLMIFTAVVWALILTFSRGAMEGALGGMIGVGMVLLYQKNKAWLIRGSLAALILLLLGLLPSFMLKEQIYEKIGDAPTARWRSTLWRETILLIHDRPFLGHGLNTYMPVMRDFLVETKSPLANGFSPSYAHNCYLQMAAETGILGLSAFLGILFMLFSPLAHLSQRNLWSDSGTTLLWIGFLAGLLGFLIHSFVEINFYSLQLPALFWFMAGLSMALDKLLSHKKKCVIKEA